jgi:hypothetical protein
MRRVQRSTEGRRDAGGGCDESEPAMVFRARDEGHFPHGVSQV